MSSEIFLLPKLVFFNIKWCYKAQSRRKSPHGGAIHAIINCSLYREFPQYLLKTVKRHRQIGRVFTYPAEGTKIWAAVPLRVVFCRSWGCRDIGSFHKLIAPHLRPEWLTLWTCPDRDMSAGTLCGMRQVFCAWLYSNQFFHLSIHF